MLKVSFASGALSRKSDFFLSRALTLKVSLVSGALKAKSEFFTELGTQQIFSLATTTTQPCYIASGTSQGPEKNQKIVRPQCLDGVATINIVKWQLQTTLWPDNMVTLCSGFLSGMLMLHKSGFFIQTAKH